MKENIIPEGMREINIEKGELLVNPSNGKIIRSYVMQKPHNDNGKDPIENFTIAPIGAGVIPKKWSKAYEQGDKLRRETILRNLVRQSTDNKFKTGGFIKTLGDIGMGYVNNMGSPLGIQAFGQDKFYNKDIGNLSATTGEMSKQLAPIAAGAVGGPLASTGLQMTQQFTSTPKYADGGYVDDLYQRSLFPKVDMPIMMNPANLPANNFSNYGNDLYKERKPFQMAPTGKYPLNKHTTDRSSFLPPSGMGDDSANRPSNFKFNKDMAIAGAGAIGNSVGSIYDMLWTKGGRRYDRENYGSVVPNLIDSSEAVKQSDQSYAMGKDNIRKLNPSGGGLLSAYSALASKRAAARAGIIQNTENQNANIKNQFAQYNKGLEIQGMIDTSQNKARSEDIFRKGLRDTSTNMLMGVKDYQTGQTNDLYLKMLASKYGHLPSFQNFLTDANLNK